MSKSRKILVVFLGSILVISLIIFYEVYYNNNKYSYYSKLVEMPVVKALNIGIIKEYKKDSAITVMKVEDLNSDGKKEFITKTDDKLSILNNEFEILYECSVGSTRNGHDDIFITDIEGDGKKEIITVGGQNSLYENINKDYSFANTAWIVGNDYFIKFSEEPELGLLIELRRHFSSLEIIDKKSIKVSLDDWNNFNSEKFSLRIVDNRCNVISEYFISDRAMGIDKIISGNFDEDADYETVIVESFFGELNDVYMLDNNIVSVVLNDQQKGMIDSVIKSEQAVVQDKIKEYDLDGQLLTGDLDADGTEELVVFSIEPQLYVGYGGNTIIHALNSLDGSLIWKHNYPAQIQTVQISDINNDGFDEIIVVGYSNPRPVGKDSSVVTIFGILDK